MAVCSDHYWLLAWTIIGRLLGPLFDVCSDHYWLFSRTIIGCLLGPLLKDGFTVKEYFIKRTFGMWKVGDIGIYVKKINL